MLEKTFAANKSYKEREKSEKLKVPKGTIIQFSAKGENGITDNVRWWLELDGVPIFPWKHTENHWGLWAKPTLGHIDDCFKVLRDGGEIQLVGYNTHGTTAYWLQAFVTVNVDE